VLWYLTILDLRTGRADDAAAHMRELLQVATQAGLRAVVHAGLDCCGHLPSVLRRLLVAILVGGNLQVPSGKVTGATFTKVPLCTSATEIGCAIAFPSYSSQPPADSVFGRPGQGVSLQSGQTATAGQQVACVNPAGLPRLRVRPRPGQPAPRRRW
jgi:Protein of unknown function (DUF3089)